MRKDTENFRKMGSHIQRKLINRKKNLEKELKRILHILKRDYQPEKIILFGSLAKGRIKEWSDIDLILIKRSKKRFLDRIGEVIKLCSPKIGVDFIVYTPEEFRYLSKVEPFIQEEVLKKGKVIYEKG